MGDERQTDFNDARPSSVNHLIGQQSVKEQILVAVDSAHQDNRKFENSLLVGPPGLGKTAAAQIIAAEMATDYLEVLGQSLKSVSELYSLLLQAESRAVFFIDEAQELDKSLQTALYLALDQRRVHLHGIRTSIPIKDFTILLATTDEYQLLQPLRDRMQMTLRFQFYQPEHLATIARIRASTLGWEVEPEVLTMIPPRSRGTPRLALRLLQAGRRVARAEASSVITVAHLERACVLEKIDPMGLGPDEQKYLSILVEGPSPLNMLASRLGLPAKTISEVVEPFLIRSGLVVKDERCRRQLSAEGREHAANSLSHSRKGGV